MCNLFKYNCRGCNFVIEWLSTFSPRDVVNTLWTKCSFFLNYHIKYSLIVLSSPAFSVSNLALFIRCAKSMYILSFLKSSSFHRTTSTANFNGLKSNNHMSWLLCEGGAAAHAFRSDTCSKEIILKLCTTMYNSNKTRNYSINYMRFSYSLFNNLHSRFYFSFLNSWWCVIIINIIVFIWRRSDLRESLTVSRYTRERLTVVNK